MTKKARTIEKLRNSVEDKLYVRCSSKEIFCRFLTDLEAEGYMLGDRKPTEADASYDIKAVEYGEKMSNVGTIGHIACQTGGGNIHIIDYEQYINGNEDYEVSKL